MRRFIPFLLLVFLFNDETTLATSQWPDILIDGKDTTAIFSNPLEQYLGNQKNRYFCDEELHMTSTACYRGYQAIWEIKKGKLFLLKVKCGCGEDSHTYFDLRKEFHTAKKVFAKWYTGVIYSPRGEELQNIEGYGSIYEKERIFYVSNGEVDSISDKSYLQYDKNKLNPSLNFLSDTIKKIIISNLDINKINEFPDSLVSAINIRFNDNGVIDSINNEFTYNGVDKMEEYIYVIAIKSLNKLPPLMKVANTDYHSPNIRIFFSTYCLKNPCDFKYGCEGYGCHEKSKGNTPKHNLEINKSENHTMLVWIIVLIITGLALLLIFRRIKRKQR